MSAPYRWFVRGRVVAAVEAALRAGGASAADVVVDGDVALARALGERGWTVSAVAAGKATRRAPRPIDAVPGERRCTAVVGVGDTAAAWAAAVVDGGVVVMVGRAPAVAAAAALAAGLIDLEQRAVGATHVTSGKVVAWGARA